MIVPISSFHNCLSEWKQLDKTQNIHFEKAFTQWCVLHSTGQQSMSGWYSNVSVSTSISTHPMFGQSINTQTHHINTKLPWMFCLSLYHLYHSISVSSLLVVSHSLVSISHSLNPLILIHMCLHSSHSTTHNHFHVLLSLFINDKVCTTFSLSSIPSQTRIGVFVEIDCEWRNVSVLQKPHFILIPFFPFIFTCFLSVLSLCSSFWCQYTPLSIPPTECCVLLKHIHPRE